MNTPAASFVIPTRGRADLVAALLRSIEAQTVPVQVLVMDDGGSRELAALLQREFPGVEYYALGSNRGPTFQRNRGIERAASEFVFAVDDDTVLESRRTVAQTLAEFGDPRIAAVGIPYINVRYESEVRQRAPSADDVWVIHTFTGASHAVRRSAFLSAGGYREHYFYMGEEGDLCIRLLGCGHVVRCGTADPILHLESPLRDRTRADFCGRRNDILFTWHNVPASALPVHLAGTTLNGVASALRAPHPQSALRGIAAGFGGIWTQRHSRRPVSSNVYRLQRLLKKEGPVRLNDIASRLPRAC